jgi:hypothetical protein
MVACIVGYGMIVFIIAFCIFMWKATRDKSYDSSLPHGKCEARLGYGHGMIVTCGRKTNHFSGQYWYCSQHPPKA